MNILIVGLGYSGHRFQRAFEYINESNEYPFKIKMAYVNRKKIKSDILYYSSVKIALDFFLPNIVIVSVTDGNHAEILSELEGYDGFVICEKPFISFEDDIENIVNKLKNIKGFNLNLIERYSDISQKFKSYIDKNKLMLLRANFHWGKNRINDRRPTTGVNSEVIHALDLIQWLNPCESDLVINDALGVTSDFSVSGNDVIDSVMLTGTVGNAIFSGYSSFVNTVRQRTIDMVFKDANNELVYARMIFDTPNWDDDELIVWKYHENGITEELINFSTIIDRSKSSLHTIYKLVNFSKDVINQSYFNEDSKYCPSDLNKSVDLQVQLNTILQKIRLTGPVRYLHTEKRIFTHDESNLESLG
ncbi:oxidoreductase [Marinomonas shanghaiensis]|uniref:oxidoreductase n=1 Tax=Marinomonas shanghaiensis TaxID=2202418 RepID=UPI003A922607